MSWCVGLGNEFKLRDEVWLLKGEGPGDCLIHHFLLTVSCKGPMLGQNKTETH